ncbi:hypothetical protein HHOHNEGG_00016 [Clostridium phage LPCPA6]|uniref:Holin n=1 Tax=Clostridium phage LPCPA6 TaxID=2924884 RepID=A0AAE9G8X2_9CAUD|nr:hypothetical protein PQC33_gp16 [Clostridium phage LPCPA6]UNY47193.1 hypothetical protein HHOHNEGG_00016 [Clostridium phage LPCPA6]
MNEIKELIGTFGFPLLACIVMYMDGRKDKKEFYETIQGFNSTMVKFDTTLNSIDKRLDNLETKGGMKQDAESIQ